MVVIWSSRGGSETVPESGYASEVEPVGLADKLELDMREKETGL